MVTADVLKRVGEEMGGNYPYWVQMSQTQEEHDIDSVGSIYRNRPYTKISIRLFRYIEIDHCARYRFGWFDI
jgi:hypothetical protein